MRLPKMTWGLDPGSAICGVVCLLDKRIIHQAFEATPATVFDLIIEKSDGKPFEIVIEDIYPFANKLSLDVIDTCKLIGELTYRFNCHPQVQLVSLVARSTVKKWIFDHCPDILPRVIKNMERIDARHQALGKRGLRTKTGNLRLPSFNYVDDRAIIAALKDLMGIPTPKPGKSNIYGLRDHSWQALATAKVFLEISG